MLEWCREFANERILVALGKCLNVCRFPRLARIPQELNFNNVKHVFVRATVFVVLVYFSCVCITSIQKYLSTLREWEYKFRFWYNILKCLSPFIMQCMQECACDKTQSQPSPHLAEVANCLTSEDYSPCKEPMENYQTKVWLLTWGWTPSPVSETDVQRRRHLFVWVFLNIPNNPVFVRCKLNLYVLHLFWNQIWSTFE